MKKTIHEIDGHTPGNVRAYRADDAITIDYAENANAVDSRVGFNDPGLYIRNYDWANNPLDMTQTDFDELAVYRQTATVIANDGIALIFYGNGSGYTHIAAYDLLDGDSVDYATLDKNAVAADADIGWKITEPSQMEASHRLLRIEGGEFIGRVLANVANSDGTTSEMTVSIDCDAVEDGGKIYPNAGDGHFRASVGSFPKVYVRKKPWYNAKAYPESDATAFPVIFGDATVDYSKKADGIYHIRIHAFSDARGASDTLVGITANASYNGYTVELW